MIDEKGRVFGKINLIDLLVLLVAIAAVVVLAVQLVGSHLEEPEPTATVAPTPTPVATPVVNTSLIEYTVKYTRMDPVEFEEIKKHFDEGDRQLLNPNGTEAKGSQVVEIRSEPYIVTVTDDDGTIHTEADPFYVNAVFTLRSITDNSESNAFYGQEVRIGRSFLIKTQFYELYGLIVDCETLELNPPKSGK